MSRVLRPHQTKAVDGVRSSLMAGFRRPLLQLPTGAGKTVIAGAIVKGARAKGKRVLFVAPAISLIDQTVRSFFAEGIRDIGVIQGNHPMTKPDAPVQVASIQTLQRRAIPPFDVVVVDECFAAGTLIETPNGSVPIEQIKPGDLVFNATGVGTVESIVSQQKQAIALELSNGSTIVCTQDHPFFCERGWVAAGDLEVGSGLFSHEDLRRLWSGGASLGLESGSSDGRGTVCSSEVLLRILREEAREPDAGYCGPAEDVRNATTDRAHAEGAWRQWQADPIASDEAARSAGRRVADRVRDEDRREARPEPTAVLLQDRHCEPLANDRNRSGREHSSRGTGEAEGQRQGDVPCSVRVVSISREERGGPEAVYNLRVSGHPSYFAGGVLVHNCHRWFEMLGKWMAAETWQNIPFIGLSATPWTKGLGKHYDDLIQVTTTAELIEAGYLSPFRVYAPSHPDLGGVRTVAGDYHEGDLGEAMNKPELVADVVTTWRQRGESRPTFVFAVDRAHAKRLQSEFEKVGINCGYIDAYTPPDEREAMFRRFSAGETRVIASVGCLTTGVDLDVRCIVLARPTRSEMLYCQIIGRGLRTAANHPVYGAKKDCIARGTLVLTDRGEVPIENVTLADRVWDGANFVCHAGAVCKGVQPVITHDGITATPDHEVMTDEGWLSLAEAHRLGLRIARTGMGGCPLRFTDRHQRQDGRLDLEPAGGSAVRPVLANAHGSLSQSAEAARHGGVPALQWASAGYGAALAVSAMPGPAGSLHEFGSSVLRAIWGAWDRISVRRPERGGAVDRGEFGYRRPVNGDRSHQQRWSLRAGEPAMGTPGGEHEQHVSLNGGSAGSVHLVQRDAPRGEIRRRDVAPAHFVKADRRANHREVESPVEQAEGEVWDILNAGPLQRFTANGRLVHNCLILDHSDTTLRLGFVTDIHHDALDDGRERQKAEARQKPEALPKECSACNFLKPAKTPKCPACGFKAERQSEIQCEDGELVEMTPRRKKAKADEKAFVFGQLRSYAKSRRLREGWAAHKFKEMFGVWPNAHRLAPDVEPTPEILSWIKSRQIAFANRRKEPAYAAAAE